MNIKDLAIRFVLAAAAPAVLGAHAATPAGTPVAAAPDPVAHTSASARVHYRWARVNGIKVFYREAGDPRKPALLLLHGFPSSSHMYRDLIPLLASDFHLVAPDYPGAGFSEAPGPSKFVPTFENLAGVMADFTQTIGLKKFSIYMQDFGGPVGFRIAAAHPEWIAALVIQNANAYVEGIAPEVLRDINARSGKLSQQQIEEAGKAVSREFTEFMYKTGARDVDAMDPTAWNVDSWLLEDPDIKRIQTALLIDYHSNLVEYPVWQRYLRSHRPKTLIVWGKNDQIFLPAGAEAYRRDVPDAQLHYFNTGHFALEEDAPAIAAQILRFLRRTG